MAEQQPAAQTPTPTTPTTPAPTPAPTPPPPEEPKFTGDVSGLLSQPPTIDEDATDAPAEGEAATTAEGTPGEGEGEAEQPGESAGEATTDADDSSPEGGSADEPPAGGTATPAATQPAQPAADQQAAQAAQQEAAHRAQRKVQASRELSTARTALAALKAKGDIDPYEAAPLHTEISLLTAELTEIQLAEVDVLRQHEAARQQASSIDQFWAGFDQENPQIAPGRARTVYLEEEAKAIKTMGNTPEALGYARAKWEQRLGWIKGHAKEDAAEQATAATPAAKPKPATPKPTTPVGKGKPGGATVLPAGASVARPAPKPAQTAEQVLASKVGPSIKNFLD